MHGLQSLSGILPYVKDVQYQNFRPAYAEKNGCSPAFAVGPHPLGRQPKHDPDYTELAFEPVEHIGDDQPSGRFATQAEGSSQRESAPQSNPAEHDRSRHSSIDSDEPLCVQGRIKLVWESRTSLKRKREATPIKGEDSDGLEGSNDSEDSFNSEPDDSGSDEETSTHHSASISLGGAAPNAGSLGSAGMAKPRQCTTEGSIERVAQIQQTYRDEEFMALQHDLQIKLSEIVQLKEQLQERTRELDKVLAEEATTKDKYQKAKKSLSAAEEQHKAKENEWASQRNDANQATSRLQNKLTENGRRIRNLESNLSVQQMEKDTLHRHVQDLQNHNIYLQRTLDQRVKEIWTLQSQMKSTEVSAVAKSLEEVNAALKVAQKLNDDYEAQISGLEQDVKMRGDAIFERTAEVMEKTTKIGELEEELKRERARLTEDKRANETQLPHEREELWDGYKSVTAECEEGGKTWGPMGEEGFATESRLRSDEDLATPPQEAKDLQAKVEEATASFLLLLAKSKRKAAKKRERVKELKKRLQERDQQLQEKEEQLARSEQEVCSLAEIVRRRSTHKHQSKRAKREVTTLSSPPLSAQPEHIAPTEG